MDWLIPAAFAVFVVTIGLALRRAFNDTPLDDEHYAIGAPTLADMDQWRRL